MISFTEFNSLQTTKISIWGACVYDGREWKKERVGLVD